MLYAKRFTKQDVRSRYYYVANMANTMIHDSIILQHQNGWHWKPPRSQTVLCVVKSSSL